jgi:deoxyribodipyrimidine photo-lyase
MQHIYIAWFRQDLRIHDNPMLAEAAASGLPVLPVFIHAPDEAAPWSPGGASCWWLHHALQSLQEKLQALGLPLLLRQGCSLEVLRDLVNELRGKGIGVRSVLSSHLHEPRLAKRDDDVRLQLAGQGLNWWQGNAGLLLEPDRMLNQSGMPYRVFTPFWNKLRREALQPPLPIDFAALHAPDHVPASLSLSALRLLPGIGWSGGFGARWNPSLDGAHQALRQFLSGPVQHYEVSRDLPAQVGTSALSPYLHFGQLGPRQVWAATQAAMHATSTTQQDGSLAFLRELAWREFASHLLHHFPHTDLQPLNPRYAAFPWQPDSGLQRAWQKGQTGYPLVDAGMRQLWQTGWMHNRVRMITASFLVKHLLQPWQDGARWFWDTLVDADLGNNSLGWQWVAGCGADAAPYFRIFNPVLQGEKFDPGGDYVRQWVPELARMPERYIHQPWKAPDVVRQQAGVRLGQDYAWPVVEHRAARERALKALDSITT